MATAESAKARETQAYMRVFVCPIQDCKHGFIDKNRLKKHLQQKHDDVPERIPQRIRYRYSCPYSTCSYLGYHRVDVVRHLKRLHSGKMPETSPDWTSPVATTFLAYLRNALSEKNGKKKEESEESLTEALPLAHPLAESGVTSADEKAPAEEKEDDDIVLAEVVGEEKPEGGEIIDEKETATEKKEAEQQPVQNGVATNPPGQQFRVSSAGLLFGPGSSVPPPPPPSSTPTPGRAGLSPFPPTPILIRSTYTPSPPVSTPQRSTVIPLVSTPSRSSSSVSMTQPPTSALSTHAFHTQYAVLQQRGLPGQQPPRPIMHQVPSRATTKPTPAVVTPVPPQQAAAKPPPPPYSALASAVRIDLTAELRAEAATPPNPRDTLAKPDEESRLFKFILPMLDKEVVAKTGYFPCVELVKIAHHGWKHAFTLPDSEEREKALEAIGPVFQLINYEHRRVFTQLRQLALKWNEMANKLGDVNKRIASLCGTTDALMAADATIVRQHQELSEEANKLISEVQEHAAEIRKYHASRYADLVAQGKRLLVDKAVTDVEVAKDKDEK